MIITPPPSGAATRPIAEQAWLEQVARLVGALVSSGTTAERPTTLLYSGRTFYDTSLNAGAGLPIWRNTANTAWINAAGGVV